MKKHLAKLLIFIALLPACSTHKLHSVSDTSVRAYGNKINLFVTGMPDTDISKKLERNIHGLLLIRDFDVIIADEKAKKSITKLIVNISKFDAGNAGVRFLIGLGAGKGSLFYHAKYINNDKTLIDFDGFERYSVMISTSKTSISTMLKSASKHIVNLATKSHKAYRAAKKRQANKVKNRYISNAPLRR